MSFFELISPVREAEPLLGLCANVTVFALSYASIDRRLYFDVDQQGTVYCKFLDSLYFKKVALAFVTPAEGFIVF